MATIQIRDIPDDAYETLRSLAKGAGQSLQAYMRQRVVELARHSATKAEMFAEMRALVEADGGSGVTIDDILADLREDRR
jgi:antitoxin FitA